MFIEGNLEKMGNKITQKKNSRNHPYHHTKVTVFMYWYISFQEFNLHKNDIRLYSVFRYIFCLIKICNALFYVMYLITNI